MEFGKRVHALSAIAALGRHVRVAAVRCRLGLALCACACHRCSGAQTGVLPHWAGQDAAQMQSLHAVHLEEVYLGKNQISCRQHLIRKVRFTQTELGQAGFLIYKHG